MKTPFWKTYVALAVLAGLTAYIFLVERKRQDKPEKPKEKVLALDKAKVKELSLAPASGETIRLVKEKDWRMTAPSEVTADNGEVESLLSSLESLEIDEVVVENPSGLEEFGLASPKLTVSALLEGASEPLRLLLGEKTPDGGSVYAKLPARPRVFTIPAYVESSFSKKPFDLRDRDVLHVKRDAVKSLVIGGPEGSYTLQRDDKGEWAFTLPLRTRAGRWSVDGRLGLIENLRMESVAAEQAKDLKPFGLAKPSRTVVLGLADGTRKSFEIGSATPEKKYYAREAGNPRVVVIPAALVEDLAKGMGELRAKRLLEVASYEVEGLEVEVEGAKKVYVRSSAKDKEGLESFKWKRTSPDNKDVETRKVEDALFALGGIEVQEFIDVPQAPATYSLDTPVLKVTVRSAGKPPVSVELGRKDGAFHARRLEDEAVLKLDPTKGEELLKIFKEL